MVGPFVPTELNKPKLNEKALYKIKCMFIFI
jgi:hypothetical protein